jgi:hypothetical protein
MPSMASTYNRGNLATAPSTENHIKCIYKSWAALCEQRGRAPCSIPVKKEPTTGLCLFVAMHCPQLPPEKTNRPHTYVYNSSADGCTGQSGRNTSTLVGRYNVRSCFRADVDTNIVANALEQCPLTGKECRQTLMRCNFSRCRSIARLSSRR